MRKVQKSKITIITAVKNGMPYIEDSINSFHSQNYKNKELIVVYSKSVDGTEKLSVCGLKVIQSQAKYEGGYWNTTGIARPVTISSLLPQFELFQSNILFHGATGRGNDQVRFELATKMLNPDINVYAPWRDELFLDDFPGRAEMIEYCDKNNLPIKPSAESRYSTDANLLGLTHEAGDLENIEESPYFVEPGMGVWPWDATDKPELISIKWEKGIPVKVNGDNYTLVEVFKLLNDFRRY